MQVLCIEMGKAGGAGLGGGIELIGTYWVWDSVDQVKLPAGQAC